MEGLMHPDANQMADYLNKTISNDQRREVEAHITSCEECLKAMTAAHETIARFRNDKKKDSRKVNIMKKINPYLALAILFFLFSFITPKFFIQSLVATLLFGIKWVADSRSTKMLVMIHDAWKRGDDKGVSRILNTIERDNSRGLDPAIKLKSKII
jgi:hypothetical protein